MADAHGSVIGFVITTACADDVLVAQVKAALDRRLPELRDGEYARTDTLRIVANGPSALGAPLDGPTLALNGSLKLFTDQGLAPTYWAACDPQELVADFLTDPPKSTKYLIASKCHPRVFEALRDRDVTIWHLDDEPTWPMLWDRDCVRISVSITLVSFELMSRLGYRKFETWGWDGCIMDGQGHAVQQAERTDRIEIEVSGRDFLTTTSWALEAEDAVNKLRGRPYAVTVRGNGMFAAILSEAAVPGLKVAA